MKSSFFFVLGLIIAAGMLLTAVVLPNIQVKRFKDNRAVTLHVETARRLIAQYDPSLVDDANRREVLMLVDPQREAVPLAGADLDALLQAEADLADDINSELSDYSKLPTVSQMQAAEQELLTLIHGAEQWSQHARPRPPTSLKGVRMIEQGGSTYEKQLAASARFLNDAEAQVRLALGIVPQHAVANRLLGMIYYLKGLAAAGKDADMRVALAAQRFGLKALLQRARGIDRDRQLVELSEIDARIAEAEQDLETALAEVQTQREVVENLKTKVADLQKRVDSAVAWSEAAREVMETLQDLGVDLGSPTGFADFKTAYEEQANNYRVAVMEAHVLRYGTLSNAAIDYTGDYIHGKYEPIIAEQSIQVDRGLLHFEQDLASAEGRLQNLVAVSERLAENVQALGRLKDNLQRRSEQAIAVREELKETLLADFAAFQELQTGVGAQAALAVKHFGAASKAFGTAINGVNTEERYAKDVQPTDPRQRQFHFSTVAADQRWLKGQLYAQQADCELRSALVSLGGYQDAQANVRDLAALAQFRDSSEELASWEETAAAKKTAALDRSTKALELLEERAIAPNAIGPGNWIVAAQIGAAYYVQALLDTELAAEKATEWYKVALENREDQPFARDHVAMRDFILTQTGPRDE